MTTIYNDPLFSNFFYYQLWSQYCYFANNFRLYNNFNTESNFHKGMEFCSMMCNLEQCLMLNKLSIFLKLNERNGVRSLALKWVIMNSLLIYHRMIGYHFSKYIMGYNLKIICERYFLTYYSEQTLSISFGPLNVQCMIQVALLFLRIYIGNKSMKGEWML